MKSEVKGIIHILVAAFLYSFFGIFTKIIGFNISIFYAALVRVLLAILIMTPFLLVKGNWVRVIRHDWVWISVRAFSGSMIAFVANYYAFYNLTIGTTYFIFYAGSTVGGFILGSFLFSEQLTQKKIIALVLSVFGLFTIYAGNIQLGNPIYMTLALTGGVATAVWNTFSKKISGAYSAVQLNFLDMAFSGVFFLIGSLVFQESWVIPTLSKVWIANGLFALMFLLTGQLIVWGFKHLEAQIASLVLLAEILFGIIFGYLFFGETLTVGTVLGGSMIIAAIVIPELGILFKRKNKHSGILNR